MFQIIANGSAEDHPAVRRAFANLVRELRKTDPKVEVRYLSVDGHADDHVDHPSGTRNPDGSMSFTGENPQLISGNESEIS